MQNSCIDMEISFRHKTYCIVKAKLIYWRGGVMVKSLDWGNRSKRSNPSLALTVSFGQIPLETAWVSLSS